MQLTTEEKAMLAGDHGPAVQKAMEIITALGKIYHADNLVAVGSVQVAGVSYKNLGEAGLEFLAEWAAQGGRVRVPTTLNPAGLDLARWKELGFSASFASKQQRVIEAFAAMGVSTTCTCTPYFIGNVPATGDHIAWAESSAVSFANSVLGARTNREGGPSALAAAITGRTARYGLHLAANRRAHLLVEVGCPVESSADFGALGALVGKVARNRVPYFSGLRLPITSAELREGSNSLAKTPYRHLSPAYRHAADCLKSFGASMAATGAVALYHVEELTPEANMPDIVAPDADTLQIESLAEGYATLDSDSDDAIDLIWIGCPHASLDELEQVITLLGERVARVALWVTLARNVRNEAERAGLVAQLEARGGQVVADTCMIVAPMHELGFRRMGTLSGKGAYYGPGHSGLAVRYGSLETCVEAAATGRWPTCGKIGT
jgi:hypothetical protein